MKGLTKKQALKNVGLSRELGNPEKMPGFAYGLQALKTCPIGAKLATVKNSVCSSCYALKNNYVYPSVKLSHKRRKAAIEKDLKLWVQSMTFLIDRECKRTGEFYFRWNDSGDLYNDAYLNGILVIAGNLPNVKFWLPTREYKRVKSLRRAIPPNLVIRLSAPMINQILKPKRFNSSSTITKGNEDKAVYICPAPKQDNNCGNCRACWNPAVKDVSYYLH